ncbi:superoxide dismutase family protein [Croceicoccus naphthovorans]|uniref:Uncharacterized protein n=1 Tax=Croceicoccus naphthovorans TaxID=1348774 RepID=A0A0G3XHZ2_9SPHN|nr:superoxide dismutase family protein [Croceicoccus naphthovorans]AKM10231.1 hypothetical protein AB433_10060 [Croceicoccus naphthovorans]MBB3990507.1 Cu-Zn family superoxide dismutase [Croceicoccus naphthovorans]
MNKFLPAVASIALAASLAACSGSEEPAGEATAEPVAEETASELGTAELKDAEGNVVGVAMVTGTDGALNVKIDVDGLPAGTHGAHIHTTGDCSAADFTSAGGHWNPTEANHGTESEAPNPHAGDTGNIEIDENGAGTLSNTSTGTWAGLFDTDGSAFVIHADADDMKSQPSGNAGARIACGVFVKG